MGTNSKLVAGIWVGMGIRVMVTVGDGYKYNYVPVQLSIFCIELPTEVVSCAMHAVGYRDK